MSLQAANSLKTPTITKLRLPHPHLITYHIIQAGRQTSNGENLLQVQLADKSSGLALHNTLLYFSLPDPNSSSPKCTLAWEKTATAGQLWLIFYAIFTLEPELEVFQTTLLGPGAEDLRKALEHSMIAVTSADSSDVLILRSAFWQGAFSPFGRAAWTPEKRSISSSHEPILYMTTTRFPESRVHATHPRRIPKPTPGSVVYSRWIASLDEHFSLIALNWKDPEHVNLFHTWQNDPRVAKGWNETGTYEQHQEYLRKCHEDPHTLCVLGRFNDTCFSYFEIYWCKEDTVGAYYSPGDFERGRHSLVGDPSFRGAHRVLAWWPSVIHYCFLDDNRTDMVVGEPNAKNNTVMKYDYMFGLHVDKLIDFPHKRAALVKVSRERFFTVCPLSQRGGFVAGTGLVLPLNSKI